MSISNPTTQAKNPTKKFIEFKNGVFRYYDKEKKDNVKIEYPFEFIICDERSTIKGYSDKNNCGIYSNDVLFTTKEEFNVSLSSGGTIAKGLYKDIKNEIMSAGGRYAKAIYAIHDNELIKITLTGAALKSWIDKKSKINNPKYIVSKTIEEKKGATIYKVPIFEEFEITKDELEKAIEVDTELQKYFNKKNDNVENMPKVYSEEEEYIKAEKEAKNDFKPSYPIDDEFNIPEIKHESTIDPKDLPF